MEIQEFKVTTYSGIVLNVKIGGAYGGEGCVGKTDGRCVEGELKEINPLRCIATIWSYRLNLPCSVKLRSLYEL